MKVFKNIIILSAVSSLALFFSASPGKSQDLKDLPSFIVSGSSPGVDGKWSRKSWYTEATDWNPSLSSTKEVTFIGRTRRRGNVVTIESITTGYNSSWYYVVHKYDCANDTSADAFQGYFVPYDVAKEDNGRPTDPDFAVYYDSRGTGKIIARNPSMTVASIDGKRYWWVPRPSWNRFKGWEWDSVKPGTYGAKMLDDACNFVD